MWRKIHLATRAVGVAISSIILHAAQSHLPAYIHAFYLRISGFSSSLLPLSSITSGFSDRTTRTV